MKKSVIGFMSLLLVVCITSFLQARQPDVIDFTKLGKAESANPTPSVNPTQTPVETVENKNELPPDPDAPLDGIVEKKTLYEKEVLAWAPIRENDIMWSKRIWRVIDVREKMNLPFVNPEANFFSLLYKAVTNKNSGIFAYKPDNDKFFYKMTQEEAKALGERTDTVEVISPFTGERTYKAIKTRLNPENIKRYRIKEEWYFDKQYSTLKVRILGIAPLIEETDDAGNFLHERPLFWVNYPQCREYLAREIAFMEGNDSNPMTWEDMFEMRRFSSYIFKESNIYNRRLQDYLSGVDLLLEGEKIKQEIFNFEHDLWSY